MGTSDELLIPSWPDWAAGSSDAAQETQDRWRDRASTQAGGWALIRSAGGAGGDAGLNQGAFMLWSSTTASGRGQLAGLTAAVLFGCSAPIVSTLTASGSALSIAGLPFAGATLSLLALIETPEAMEGYLLRAQGQDDAKRRAQRCIEAAESAVRLVAEKGLLS